MAENREVITGSDFKRMVAGAYSEFLLEYENINQLKGEGKFPGTHILRTMGAAVMPLWEVKDNNIGGLSRRVSTAAVFGARGSSGVVLAQLFRGIGKGLSGKYDATSSEFGKAFQYGILYAQRVFPEDGQDRPFIKVAKAVAKGAYYAVRANKAISDILETAIDAGEKAMHLVDDKDAGARIMFTFLKGCLKGLDGNFVSPAVSLSLGIGKQDDGMPDPRKDLVRPYCVRFRVKNQKVEIAEMERQLKEFGVFTLVEQRENGIAVHLHTDHPGKVLEHAVGWDPLREIHITNMSEPHALGVHDALMQVAVMAVAEDAEEAQHLQEAGVHVLVAGSEEKCPSVAELVGAAHSDMAASYVMVASSMDYQLAFRQVKRLLGNRVALVLCKDKEAQDRAIQAFDSSKTAEENAKRMLSVSAGK